MTALVLVAAGSTRSNVTQLVISPCIKRALVAQGFTQHPGEDFFETFAPVAKIESICMLLAIAAILDWEIHVIDVDPAFLNSKMREDQTVYLSQPPGYIAKGKEDFVWKLAKALYGLKQSGHLWYQEAQRNP